MNPHPLTEAWEQFQKENPDTFSDSILTKPEHSIYLSNRLYMAFAAGHAAGEMAERKRIVEIVKGEVEK